MDNVRFHHSESVKDFCEEINIGIKYLPPYSPDLNPINNIFSTIKYRFKALRPSPVSRNMIKEYVARIIDSIFIYDFIMKECVNFYRRHLMVNTFNKLLQTF